MWEHLQKNAF